MARPPRPLAANDDRNSFDCGRDSLNSWFRRHAWSNHVTGASRVNVIADPADGRIAGFVALFASQIDRGYLPKVQRRNQPDPVPVVLLGQLAVDKDFQSKGYATSLIMFALRSALRASDDIGCVGVVTTSIDANAVGEVGVSAEGEYRNYSARATAAQGIEKGRRVRVVRMSGGVLFVEEVQG